MRPKGNIVFLRAMLVFVTLGLIEVVHWPLASVGNALIGCFGAAAVLTVANPTGRMARPKTIFLGLLVSALTGVVFSMLMSDVTLRVLCACGVAMLAMGLLDVEYPPGGAAALITATESYGWSELFAPILTGTLVVVAMQWAMIALEEWMKKSD